MNRRTVLKGLVGAATLLTTGVAVAKTSSELVEQGPKTEPEENYVLVTVSFPLDGSAPQEERVAKMDEVIAKTFTAERPNLKPLDRLPGMVFENLDGEGPTHVHLNYTRNLSDPGVSQTFESPSRIGIRFHGDGIDPREIQAVGDITVDPENFFKRPGQMLDTALRMFEYNVRKRCERMYEEGDFGSRGISYAKKMGQLTREQVRSVTLEMFVLPVRG